MAVDAPATVRDGAASDERVAALLAAYRRRHGRNPRVLHVGNIANRYRDAAGRLHDHCA
jgi:hypothetical protein